MTEIHESFISCFVLLTVCFINLSTPVPTVNVLSVPPLVSTTPSLDIRHTPLDDRLQDLMSTNQEDRNG